MTTNDTKKLKRYWVSIQVQTTTVRQVMVAAFDEGDAKEQAVEIGIENWEEDNSCSSVDFDTNDIEVEEG